MRLQPLTTLSACFLMTLAGQLSAQAEWWRMYPTNVPSARYLSPMAYHEASDSVLMVYGLEWPSGSQMREAWQLQNGNWTLLPGSMPPFRHDPLLAYDANRERLVMFGGTSSSGQKLNEVWEWDGTQWFAGNAPVSPIGRILPAFCYDPDRQVVVMFGGAVGGGVTLQDTWEWDGSVWQQIAPAVSPPTRYEGLMAFDPTSRRILLHGGRDEQPSIVRNDTWTYDGVAWTMHQPSTPPPFRSRGAMVTDSNRGRVLLFGGTIADPFSWEWNGSEWSVVAQIGPAVRDLHRMAYDSTRGRVVLHGGNIGGPFGFSMFADDTWVYETPLPASVTEFGAGCAGTGSVPTLAAKEYHLPWLGDTATNIVDQVPFGQPGAFFVSSFGSTAPIALGPQGMPGCDLLVSLDVVQFGAANGDTASWSVYVPNTVSLAGVSFRQQAFVVDVGANAFGAVASNGITATLGIR